MRPLLYGFVALACASCSVTVAPFPMGDGGEAASADVGPALQDAAVHHPDGAVPGLDAAAIPGPDAAGFLDAAAPATAKLLSVTPASGGASVETPVVLHGEGFSAVSQVTVGGALATSIQLVEATSIAATFPAVELKAIGRKDVEVKFVDGSEVTLADGFEDLFDEDPVVFVHGYLGHASDYDAMVGRFKAAGYPADRLFAIQFSDNTGSNLKNLGELAPYISQALAKTGAQKVDLVSHSMGALSARLYLKRTPHPPVRDVVTIAGANHGNSLAFLQFDDGSKEMYPPFACQGQSLNDVQFELNGCLTDSGRSAPADETPGDPAWLAIRTTTDEVINPSESECLNQQKKKDCSDAVNASVSFVSHNGMLSDQGVFDQTLAHLRARNASHP